jgi:signal transduction histidine kinase
VELRILIHAPIGKDARLVAQLLERAGIACCVCASLPQLIDELARGAGALFVADEAIGAGFFRIVGTFIKSQQSWSDLPVVILSRRGDATPDPQDRYLALGNVTLVERPAQGITLISAARSALRARGRQYAMREVDRRKDEFLAMLAHELRNPLAPIRAASDLLRMAALDSARVRQTSEVISRQVGHMTGLIDDLLDLSRVSRGLVTLDATALDAHQVLSSAVEQVRPLVDARGHRLTIRTPHEAAFIHGDQKRMVQIVANVLNNAAKYTPEGGEISAALDIDAGAVTYTIADNGIGIAPDMIAHIFDMFAQAERTPDRSQGGLGIGLALVRNLVGLHGGTVAAASAGMGKGSRFTLTFPRGAAPATVPGPAAGPAAGVRARRILVVDDNHDAGDMLGMLLETAGHRVDVVDSAQAARVTLIAVTGYGQEADRRATAAAGFDAHLVKPVDMDDLLHLLARLD